MIHYLLNLPSYLTLIIVITISSIISIGALLIVRKKISWETFKENHEVGGFLFNALGLIYAVLIAFVVYATWDDYESSQDYCGREANTLQSLFFDSDGLPEQNRAAIKAGIIDYLKCVIDEDWPLLAKGEDNPNSRNKLMKLWDLYVKMDTLRDAKQQAFFQESIKKLNEVTELRRLRIISSVNHIPAMIWIVIIIGALTSIGFSLFFGTKSFKLQAIMTALFAMTNAIILILIFDLDHPFTGDVEISSLPYRSILDFLQNSMR